MKNLIKDVVVSMIVPGLMMACKKNSPNADNNSKANRIMGDIYDAKGNKFSIVNSTVTVHLLGEQGLTYDINMDGNSHYEQKVESGSYMFAAWATMPLNGNQVSVHLEPLDGKPADEEFNSATGITRDFKLSLTGLVPGGDPNDPYDYYGGHISVRDGAGNLAVKYPGYSVVFRLTGKSNCVDGSISPILDISCSVGSLQGTGTFLVNFPLARYYLSAVLRSPAGQNYPLKLTFVSGTNTHHFDFLDFSFTPAANDPDKWPSTPYVAVWRDQ